MPEILTAVCMLIQQRLEQAPVYDLSTDIALRMQSLELSQTALAARACVTRPSVSKWLKGATLQSKERFKELGMALGMDKAQLDEFLQANSYPGLYAKNPLDVVCRFVLSKAAGKKRVVRVYRKFLQLYTLNSYVLNAEPSSLSTKIISRSVDAVQSAKSLQEWLKENGGHFRAFDKIYIPHRPLVDFINLCKDARNIHEMYIVGELPVNIKKLLYGIVGSGSIEVRRLRSRLIVFGFSQNMTENEIDVMLKIARVRPVAKPLSRMDHVVLTALREAHRMYPPFSHQWAGKMEIILKVMPELSRFYSPSGTLLTAKADPIFERYYTDYAAKGILEYMRDLFTLLIKNGVLARAEAKEYTDCMNTYLEKDDYDG